MTCEVDLIKEEIGDDRYFRTSYGFEEVIQLISIPLQDLKNEC